MNVEDELVRSNERASGPAKALRFAAERSSDQ
jgi:hypothetical protein